ncbi:hypothetical protein ABIB54_003324 [Frigoribacterium sp. UYMn621]
MNNVVGATVTESMSAERYLFAASLRRFLVASLTISSILLGLVGMHALSVAADAQGGTMMHSPMLTSPTVPSGVSEQPRLPLAKMSAPASNVLVTATFPRPGTSIGEMLARQGGADMGAMDCLLLGMVCVLSSLIAFIVLARGRRPLPLMSEIRRVARVIRVFASRLALPTPPSLNALSISRV